MYLKKITVSIDITTKWPFSLNLENILELEIYLFLEVDSIWILKSIYFQKMNGKNLKFFSRLAVSLELEDYFTERKLSMDKRLRWFSKNINQIKGISIENGKISISRLEKIFL